MHVTYKSLPLLIAALALLPAAISADEKQLSVYSSAAIYSLPVVDRAGSEYVGLLELLEPLGKVNSNASGKRWKIRYNSVDGEFETGRTRARIHGRDLELPFPFLIENSRGLVPVSSLGVLLPRFLGTPLIFHESARRVFVGDVGIRPSFQLEGGVQPRLTLNFSAPVNPTIATEPGKLRMVFKRDPLVSPGSQTISFENRAITGATYSEANGVAELDISASIPLLASFSNNGQTITLAAPPTVASAPAPANKNVPSPARAPATAAANSGKLLAVVDPAHGGDERGAALTDRLSEKDVTLGFGRLLRHELEVRGFAVLLLRDSDNTLPLDQRASTANGAPAAAVYVSLHAASHGDGATVYTSLLPVEEPTKGLFKPWDSAQSIALPMSRTVANSIVSAMQKAQFHARESSASLRPLNNMTMPAVAVELCPGPNGQADLGSANYQQQAAALIAEGLAAARDRLRVQP